MNEQSDGQIWLQAIERHDLEQLQRLIEGAAAVELSDPRWVTHALEADCSDAVEMLVKAGAACEGALHQAVLMCRPGWVSLFLEHGADPNEVLEEWGCRPLHLIANRALYLEALDAHFAGWLRDIPESGEDEKTQERLEILGLLLEGGARLDPKIAGEGHVEVGFFGGLTPLDIATFTHSQILCEALKARGAVKGERRDPGLLFFLLELGVPALDDFVELFESAQSPFSLFNDRGEDLLQSAIRNGRFEEASWLIRQDAPLDGQGRSPFTPLMLVIYNLTRDERELPLLRALLDAGASPNHRTPGQPDPLSLLLSLALQIDCFEEALLLLLDAGALVEPVSLEESVSPLFMVAAHGALPWSFFELLLERGADPCVYRAGKTLLHVLAIPQLSPDEQENRERAFLELIGRGVALDARTTLPFEENGIPVPVGATPLDIAAGFQNFSLIEFLQRQGAQFALHEEKPLDAQERLFQRASLLIQAEHFSRALELLEEIVAQAPKEPRGWLLKSSLHFEIAEFEQTLEALEQVERLAPEAMDSEFYAIKGSAFFHLHRLVEAHEMFSKIPASEVELLDELSDYIETSKTMAAQMG